MRDLSVGIAWKIQYMRVVFQTFCVEFERFRLYGAAPEERHGCAEPAIQDLMAS